MLIIEVNWKARLRKNFNLNWILQKKCVKRETSRHSSIIWGNKHRLIAFQQNKNQKIVCKNRKSFQFKQKSDPWKLKFVLSRKEILSSNSKFRIPRYSFQISILLDQAIILTIMVRWNPIRIILLEITEFLQKIELNVYQPNSTESS